MIFTTTNTVPLSTWFRVEGYVTSSATVGQVELKLFSTPDHTTPTETQTSSARRTRSAAPQPGRYGLATGGTAGVTWWMDDVAVSVTGYIGPGAIVQQMACGAPSATGFTVISKPVGGTSCGCRCPPTPGSPATSPTSPRRPPTSTAT